MRDRLTDIRAAYLGALQSTEVAPSGLTHQEVFEAWLNGSVFHDDDQAQRQRWRSLTATPLLAAHSAALVEVIALRLAHCILALDGLVADYLGQDRLPEITHEPAAPPEAAALAPRISVDLHPHHQRGVRWLVVENAGTVPAFDVSLEEIKPIRGGTDDILVHGESQKLPRQRLRPGERVSLMVALDHDSPSEVEVFVAWSDQGGARFLD